MKNAIKYELQEFSFLLKLTVKELKLRLQYWINVYHNIEDNGLVCLYAEDMDIYAEIEDIESILINRQ